MISDSSLKKLCFFTALIGIAILYLYIHSIEPYSMKITEIAPSDAGKKVTIYGTITSLHVTENTTFFNLRASNASISAVVFSRINTTKIIENITVHVTGRISLYKGKLEIIAENIEEK